MRYVTELSLRLPSQNSNADLAQLSGLMWLHTLKIEAENACDLKATPAFPNLTSLHLAWSKWLYVSDTKDGMVIMSTICAMPHLTFLDANLVLSETETLTLAAACPKLESLGIRLFMSLPPKEETLSPPVTFGYVA
jgi:hypothetical protein